LTLVAREIERARRGLKLSRERLREAVRDGTFEAWSIALVEVLAWTWGMHEWLEEESPSYRTTAKTPDITSLLEAVRFARNRGVHDLVAISDSRTGLTFPLTFDLSFGPKWLPGAVFKPRRKDAKGLAAYESSLAGRPFPGPLDEAADFVIRGALLYGSPPT
jgi:hypothetical protein